MIGLVDKIGFLVVRRGYWLTIFPRGKTGGERPHNMKSPQTPFLTTGQARGLGKPEIAGFALSCFRRCCTSLTSLSEHS